MFWKPIVRVAACDFAEMVFVGLTFMIGCAFNREGKESQMVSLVTVPFGWGADIGWENVSFLRQSSIKMQTSLRGKMFHGRQMS